MEHDKADASEGDGDRRRCKNIKVRPPRREATTRLMPTPAHNLPGFSPEGTETRKQHLQGGNDTRRHRCRQTWNTRQCFLPRLSQNLHDLQNARVNVLGAIAAQLIS